MIDYGQCCLEAISMWRNSSMRDEVEKENCDIRPMSSPKIARISPLPDSRFGSRITTEEELAQCSMGFVPKIILGGQ